MNAKPVVITHIYFQTAELKQAVTLWVQEHNMLIQELIENLAEKILASNDYSISVDKVYDDTVKAPNLRMVTCGLDYELLERIDVAVKLSNPNEDAKFRSRFINEAIRRYLEPQLIESRFLETTVFLNREQAAKNLKAYRETLGLKPKEFLQKYFDTMISYPQYSLIERSGTGNVDRLIEHLSTVVGLDKMRFYGTTVEFSKYLAEKKGST
ncbi:hypothetical protein [Desulfosporosinus metallidurans]|uniref:Uncharacterized protein n=1 Tax=Desulfosporosinus metallidurans TaxID=1888891 RepID=A0A1Q8QEK7_9FIRM|nr:hypothetical protein [Desulfosporosinus metallidurans]OLN25789.1 hypothetical protein DSOL_5221 [Desulfosporosinus metallidurans]